MTMTTEMVLKEVNDYLTNGNIKALEGLKTKLENELIEVQAKKLGKVTMLKVVKSIEKKLKTGWNGVGMGLIYNDSDTQTAFTDSHRLLVLNSSLGYERVTSNLGTLRLVNDCIASNTDTLTIDMDDLKKVYLLQKAVKAKDREFIYTFKFNETLPISFNTEWLLELLLAFETDTIYVVPGKPLNTTLIKNKEGELALICPMPTPSDKGPWSNSNN